MIRVIGASVCGTSHERIGQVCQDFHAYHLLTDSLLLIAVADGAGSARCAEVGALTAVQSVVD